MRRPDFYSCSEGGAAARRAGDENRQQLRGVRKVGAQRGDSTKEGERLVRSAVSRGAVGVDARSDRGAMPGKQVQGGRQARNRQGDDEVGAIE